MCYKYSEYLNKSGTECPPQSCRPKTRVCFRYVWIARDPDESFLPVALMQPTRKFKNADEECSGYALSFFITLEKILRRFGQLRKNIPNISQTLGDHIAQGTLDENDGVQTQPDGRGHFELHEYVDVRLSPKFKVVHKLPE